MPGDGEDSSTHATVDRVEARPSGMDSGRTSRGTQTAFRATDTAGNASDAAVDATGLITSNHK